MTSPDKSKDKEKRVLREERQLIESNRKHWYPIDRRVAELIYIFLFIKAHRRYTIP